MSTMPQQQPIKLWELAGEDPVISMSHLVWRVRLLLAHKGQSYESIPWRFTEKKAIQPFDKVPVMEFHGKQMGESLDISKLLEKEFPEPAVFNASCQAVVLMDIYKHLAKEDLDYYRESREKMFGSTLEDFSADQPAKLEAFRTMLDPLRQTLQQFKFLGGDKLNYADIAVAGNFLWLKSISKIQLLEKEDPVYEWRARIFKLFDGTISKAHTYPV